MIATKDTDNSRNHSAKAGDTPALGLPYEPGSGGRRRAHALGIDVTATAAIELDDDVLWHGRQAVVTEVYPAGHDWTRTLCQIQFDDDRTTVVVGRDELKLIQDAGVRYFTSLPGVALEDTAPLPAPVQQLQPVEDDRPTEVLPAVGTVPVGAFAGVWLGLLEVLRIIGAVLAWPFHQDGGRALVGRMIDAVADGIDASADWEHTHAELIAKIVVGMLSGLVLAGLGVAYLLTVVAA